MEYIIYDFIDKANALWFCIDIDDISYDIWRNTHFAILTDRNDLLGASESLPWKFGVYRNYLGWGISWGVCYSDYYHYTWSEKITEKLEQLLELCKKVMISMENEEYWQSTERWQDIHTADLLIHG